LGSDVNDALCIALPAKKQQHRILLDVEGKFEKFSNTDEVGWDDHVRGKKSPNPFKNVPGLSPGPALEGGDHKEGEHGVQDVVVVKARPLPHPLFNWNTGKEGGCHKQGRFSASSFH
jgi:hypothetical protein